MTVYTYLCGTSRAVYQPVVYPAEPTAPRVKRDREPVRLRTALHLPGVGAIAQRYRVVALLTDGQAALICLGATRQEALERARARGAERHPGSVELRLQEWVGSVTSGRWRSMHCRAGELPPRQPRRPRRRVGRRKELCQVA